MNVNFDVESGAKNVFPDKIVLPRFFDGMLQDFRALWEFASYVDVSRARVERVT